MPVQFVTFPDGSLRRNEAAIRQAFASVGLEVCDVCAEWACETTVLASNGELYSLDTSHGGGGSFRRVPDTAERMRFARR